MSAPATRLYAGSILIVDLLFITAILVHVFVFNGGGLVYWAAVYLILMLAHAVLFVRRHRQADVRIVQADPDNAVDPANPRSIIMGGRS